MEESLGNRAVRLFVEAYNMGAVTIRDAKAILTVLAPPPNILAEYLVRNCSDNKNPCPLAGTCGGSRPYLVSRDFPGYMGTYSHRVSLRSLSRGQPLLERDTSLSGVPTSPIKTFIGACRIL